MPLVRVNITLNLDDLERIEEAIKVGVAKNRSEFIRAATSEKLDRIDSVQLDLKERHYMKLGAEIEGLKRKKALEQEALLKEALNQLDGPIEALFEFSPPPLSYEEFSSMFLHDDAVLKLDDKYKERFITELKKHWLELKETDCFKRQLQKEEDRKSFERAREDEHNRDMARLRKNAEELKNSKERTNKNGANIHDNKR